MNVLQLLTVLRARRAVIALVLLATIVLALGWIALRPAKYTARAPVLVDTRPDPTAQLTWQGAVPPSFLATQIDIIKSDRVADRVAHLLPADQPPMKTLREDAQKSPSPDRVIATELQRSLDVKPARESNVINIAWTGRSPAEAARVANAFAQAYLETNLDIKTDPARKDSAWFDDQVKGARDKLENAQKKLADFQQKAGIVSTDERADFETQRLIELNQQLMAVQGRGRGATAAAAGDANPVISNLRQQVAVMEAKIGEASATMGSAHPMMQRMQAELSAMRRRLSEESSRVGATAESSAAAQKARERELQAAIADQKQHVLAMNKQRGELALLKSDVDSANKAFEAVSTSAAQAHLQSMSRQTNVMKLASAVEPLDPTGPTAVQALAIAIVAGGILGIAAALLLELLNRRVRSADDLQLVTQLPILAAIPAANASRYGAKAPLRLAHTSRRLALASHRSAA